MLEQQKLYHLDGICWDIIVHSGKGQEIRINYERDLIAENVC